MRAISARNGTFVNGERIWGERPLSSGDEIRVGGVRLVARLQDQAVRGTRTVVAEGGPVTRREREVLVALCRPDVLGRGVPRTGVDPP